MVRLLLTCTLLLFCGWPLALAAQEGVIQLADGVEEVNPGPLLGILEDPARVLTIEDVSGPDMAGRWRPSTMENLNFGFSSSVFWLRFRLSDRSSNRGPWYLELENPLIDYVQFYQFREGRLRVNRTGDQLPFHSREIDHRMFVFRLFTGPVPRTYYLRIQTPGAMTLPLMIRSQSSFAAHIDRAQLILGLYYGIMGIMIVYNISLFFIVRSVIYFNYVLYIGSYTLLFLSWNGLVFQYLWPLRAWPNFLVPWLVAVTHMLALNFTRSFLETSRTAPTVDRAMLFLMGLALIMILTMPFFSGRVFNQFLSVYTAVVILAMIGAGIVTLFKGVRAARFYLLAVGVVLLSALVAMLRVTGLVEANFLTRWINQIGTAIEVALLSLALGDRINIIRAEREAARAEALENRRRADRLKDQFLSNISHELRTPLAEVYGYAEILVDEKDGIRDDLQPMTEAVHRASGRLSELIQDLMLLTSLDGDLTVEKTALPVRQIVDESLAALREAIGERGIAVVRRDGLDLEVFGDAGLLCKACYHILKNAVFYNRDGGLVEIDLARVAGEARLSVRDTGSGIPAAHIDKIWEKFHRVDSSLTYSVPGVGLGLFMTRRIVEMHGGRVGVASQPGMGSTFTLSLPLEEASTNSVEHGR